jgi:ketosteroid isomerase-like protein
VTIELDPTIETYVGASNRHDVAAILSCFSDDAFVHDEAKPRCGKEAIKEWLVETIEKYKFQFKPLSCQIDNDETVVQIEVSGTFDGSPVTLDYRFKIENDKISSLAIS